jgi:hypothetical protein
MGVLRVKVIEAKDLPVKDKLTGSSDPYVVVQVGKQKHKTKVKKKNLNPVWDELFTFNINNPYQETLCMEVRDYDFLSKDDPMGHIYVPLANLFRGKELDCWFNLAGSSRGKIRVSLLAVDFGRDPSQMPSQPGTQQAPVQQVQTQQQVPTQQIPVQQPVQQQIPVQQPVQPIQQPMQQQMPVQQQIPMQQPVQQQFPVQQSQQYPAQQQYGTNQSFYHQFVQQYYVPQPTNQQPPQYQQMPYYVPPQNQQQMYQQPQFQTMPQQGSFYMQQQPGMQQMPPQGTHQQYPKFC